MVDAMKAAEAHIPVEASAMLFVAETEEMPDGNKKVAQIRYVGSKINREDAIRLMKTWLFEQGEKEAWMEHIK